MAPMNFWKSRDNIKRNFWRAKAKKYIVVDGKQLYHL